MRDFRENKYSNNNGNRFEKRNSDRPNYNTNFNRRESDDRQMFSAVCDNCGKECQVPFKPSGDKPVYCNDCFRKMKDTTGERTERYSNNKPDRRDSRSQSFENRDERPMFREEKRETNPSNIDLKQQLDAINSKLNQILKSLEPQLQVKAEAVKPTEEKKPETKKPEPKVKAATKKTAVKKTKKA